MHRLPGGRWAFSLSALVLAVVFAVLIFRLWEDQGSRGRGIEAAQGSPLAGDMASHGSAPGEVEQAMRQGIEQQFVHAAQTLNRNLPREIDESTTLVAVTSGPGLSMHYRYALKMPAVDSGASVSQAADPSLRWRMAQLAVVEKVCEAADMRDFMDYGAFYEYTYTDTSGKILSQFSVDLATCLQFDATQRKSRSEQK